MSIGDTIDHATDKLEEHAEKAVSKTNGLTQVANWASITLLPIVIGWAFILQQTISETKTDVLTTLNDQQVADEAAFATIAKNEQANTAQWQRINQIAATSDGNEKVLQLLQLFLVGGELNTERLHDVVKITQLLDEHDIKMKDIITAIEAVEQFRSQYGPAGEGAGVSNEMTRPSTPVESTQQRQAQASPPLSKEQLKRYMEQRKAEVRK